MLYPEDYTVGRRYPVTYDSEHPSHLRLSEEGYDIANPLFFAWLPAVVVGLVLTVMVRRTRRARTLAERGPWSRLDLWYVPGGAALVGDRAGGYVRAQVPPSRRLPWVQGSRPQPGPVLVAGNPEPGERVAVVDRLGPSVPLTRRLRVPTAKLMAPPVDAPSLTEVAHVIRGLWVWVTWGFLGGCVVLAVGGGAGAALPGAQVAVFGVGATALVASLARVRVVVDRDGMTICDGLGTRRLGWEEIEQVRDGHYFPRPVVSGAGLPCIEIVVAGEVQPLRPRAMRRFSGQSLWALLEAVRPYTRVPARAPG